MLSLAAVILAPTISFGNGIFSIVDGKETIKVAIKPGARQITNSFSLKSGNASYKWDTKGLSVTAAGKTRSTKFAELPTSPRFFSAEEIAARTSHDRNAIGLSGWEVVDDKLYLVPRWEGKDKRTWLEMLVKIDLKQASPWFETVTQLEGTSKAYSAVEDRVFRAAGALCLVSESAREWGISLWPLAGGVPEFKPLGEGTPVVDRTTDGSFLRFIESTTYGTRIAGVVQLPSFERLNFAETRDPIFYPGESADIVQINSTNGVVLRNTESGLELKLPTGVGVKNVKAGVLVWTPREAPTQAVLYSKSGLRAVTRWKKQ
ncbi:MAG: hypothetical protein JNK63_06330 [Chthonomonas sp.]|nr:hypothetical protein [Chthonomonas sp.]